MTPDPRPILHRYEETLPDGRISEVVVVADRSPAFLAGIDLLVERAFRETAEPAPVKREEAA